jgi:V/A-type H+-transporting ATPase subunit I
MTKVSITGHKDQLQPTIETLHRLKLLDIDTYDGELETGEPFEEAEELSELLVDIRSVRSKLPNVEYDTDRNFDLALMSGEIEDIKKKVEQHEEELTEFDNRISSLKEQEKVFKKLRGIDLSYSDLQGTDTLEVFIGDLDEDFENVVETDRYEVFSGQDAAAVLYSKKHAEEVQRALRETDSRQIKMPETDMEGTPDQIYRNTQSRLEEVKKKRDSVEQDYKSTAQIWGGKLEQADEFLTEKVQKAEAPLRFATTDKTFIAEGWIPEEKFDELGEELHNATNGRVHLQTEPTDEEPPVKYENNRVVKPFESLTDLVSAPKYHELDPSFVLMLTFPLFFGFMIGDAGYGLTTLAVFYGGYKIFPQASEIFKSLMYASLATIAFGLAFGDAFGFIIFGHHHNALAAATGIHLFEQIPILFHRAEHLGQVFNMAVAIGFIHVNLGLLLGFYNIYEHHGLKEAFLEKISWFVLEIGALASYAYGIEVGGPILLISVVMLYIGEGFQGIVEIPALLSNILSYLRIFGVAVAAISLAAVVNAMADPLFKMGGIGLALGTLVLIVGHVFNTFIKIMEGFLQGIRLHYVEMFTKFYEGGGKKYAPFGAEGSA